MKIEVLRYLVKEKCIVFGLPDPSPIFGSKGNSRGKITKNGQKIDFLNFSLKIIGGLKFWPKNSLGWAKQPSFQIFIILKFSTLPRRSTGKILLKNGPKKFGMDQGTRKPYLNFARGTLEFYFSSIEMVS